MSCRKARARRWRRRLVVRVGVSLGLGAAIVCASPVLGGFWPLHEIDDFTAHHPVDEVGLWLEQRFQSTFAQRYQFTFHLIEHDAGLELAASLPPGVDRFPSPSDFYLKQKAFLVHRTGWPLVGFDAEAVVSKISMDHVNVDGGIPVRPFNPEGNWPARDLGIVAFHPVFPGVVVNLFLWGLTIFLILHVIVMVRIGVRRRAGKCPQCAYLLSEGENAGCPECGWRRE